MAFISIFFHKLENIDYIDVDNTHNLSDRLPSLTQFPSHSSDTADHSLSKDFIMMN